MNKQKIITHAQQLFKEHILAEDDHLLCWAWALMTKLACEDAGLRAVLIGGAAKLIIPPKTIEYAFTEEMNWEIGQEMIPVHAWCALPDEQEIIDMSIPSYMRYFERTFNISWPFQPLTPLWCNTNDVPEGWIYKPSLKATHIIWRIIQDSFRVIT